jgi:hypothetical protein
MTVELLRHPGLGYVTPDGRWRVCHQPEMSCAPARWWWVTDTGPAPWPPFAVPTLALVKGGIALRLQEDGR